MSPVPATATANSEFPCDPTLPLGVTDQLDEHAGAAGAAGGTHMAVDHAVRSTGCMRANAGTLALAGPRA